ncbi:MAG: hypothetical protein OMM_13579, partial [Candidatus Magnetoglobus multicellularis str. Araruama]
MLLLQAFVHAKSIKLDDIVVTASKTEKPLKEDTSNTTVISKDDIQKYHPRDIMDLLQHVPGMTMNNMANGSYYIGFRGTEPSPKGTMIMIDGIEMNTAANYILSQNIPVSNIDRIEVIKNPSSALYGPAGVGGVINIITQKPSKPFESQIKLSFGSFLRKESVINCKGLMDNNFSYGLSVVMNDTKGFRDESNTNYQIISPRFGYETEKFDFEFISSIKPSKGYQPGGLPLDQYKENPKRATSPNSVGKGYATTWGVNMGFVINDNSRLNLKSSYRTDNWNAEMDGNYLEGDDQRHLTSEANYQLSLTKGIIKNTLLAGIEYRIYHSIYHIHP